MQTPDALLDSDQAEDQPVPNDNPSLSPNETDPNPYSVIQQHDLPNSTEHLWQVDPVPGEPLFELRDNYLRFVRPTIPEERAREAADAISKIFDQNPKVAWEFLEAREPSFKWIADIRERQLHDSADADPRPLRHYVTIGAKRLVRHLNLLIHKFATGNPPKTEDFLQVQMCATSLRYINDLVRRPHRRRSGPKPKIPANAPRPRGRPRKRSIIKSPDEINAGD